MTIIAEILSLMHQVGWTRNRLAREAGVAQSGVSKLLAGKGGMRLDALEKLRARLLTEIAQRERAPHPPTGS